VEHVITVSFILAVSMCVLGLAAGSAGMPSAKPDSITAIDIVLEPDATMIQRSEAVNARLLKVFPKGFALDATHRPHVSTLQRFVRTADLDQVYAAVGRVLQANGQVASWKLKAFKYYYIPGGNMLPGLGLGGIVIQLTDGLLALQQALMDSISPFTATTGTAAAFVTTPEAPNINQPTIDHVATFVPNQTGKHFNPHVTIGIATEAYLNEMLAEPFEAFTFSLTGMSVFQLGNFGTARTRLQTWELES